MKHRLHRTKYYRTHYNQWCCLHWMPRHDKSLTVNCCRILFMTYWHKFQMIFNSCVRCRHGVSLHLFRRRFPLLFFIRHLYLSVVARLGSVMCTEHSLLCIMSRRAPYCWLATSLFWYWAWLSFLKHFWKNAYPTFNQKACLINCNHETDTIYAHSQYMNHEIYVQYFIFS